jgi:radical SAM protein with 4Fe4S-binding SPASM domain
VTGYVRHVSAEDAIPSSTLGHLDIDLTERCDNDCVHCCVRSGPPDDRSAASEMRESEICAALDAAAELGALSVRLTGGEPLLRADFAAIYRHARLRGLAVKLFTNARNVTPEIAGLLASIPPLDPVEISVYGMTRETYERTSRARESFQQFQRGVSCLCEAGVPFVLKGALLPWAAGEADSLERWSEDCSSSAEPPGYAMLFDLVPPLPADASPSQREARARRNATITSVRPSPEAVVGFLERSGERYRGDVARFCRTMLGPPGDRLFACSAGCTVAIGANGSIRPCLALHDPAWEMPLRAADGVAEEGSVQATRALRDALHRYQSLRDTRATNPDYLRRCASCFLKGLCEQCPARSWSEHGTLDTPVEYVCDVTHEQARDLGMLLPGESAWEIDDWKARVERL